MKKILVLILLVGAVGGVIFLATKDIPAPDHRIEKAISNEKFIK